jgi:VWFA-related protein
VAGSKVDPPVEVILVIDVLDLPYQAITFQRNQVTKFLRSNGGHLTQPTSLFILSNRGLSIQPQPSTDGNAIADVLDKAGAVRAMDASSGYAGQLELFDKATHTLLGIADNEVHKPGRKILIWVGHGWPLLQDAHFKQTSESRQTLFKTIVDLQNRLREARVTVYGLFTLVGENGRGVYTGHLKPVVEAKNADPADLALQVLALHSGGRILDPSNDVAGQVASCVSDVGPYYTLVFDAGPAGENAYHKLAVQVDQPGMMVRTTSGFYGLPQ